jgi:phage terminase small subunit
MSSELTDKQQRFVEEYLIDLNATQAAIRAGYSEESARSIGSENLTKPDIQEAISDARARLTEAAQVTQERIVREYAKLAFLDIRKAFDSEGRLKPIGEMDDDTSAAIAGLEVEELYEGRGEAREHIGRIHKVKLADKKGSLDSLARHLGMFTDKTELTGPNGTPLTPSIVTLEVTSDLVKTIVQQVRDEF